jgi:Tol biopolymer transport system component
MTFISLSPRRVFNSRRSVRTTLLLILIVGVGVLIGPARRSRVQAFSAPPTVPTPCQPKIAFVSDRDDGNLEIYIMNADGTGQTRLTNNPANDLRPSLSENGAKIAFESDRDQQLGEIYVMNADGSSVTRLTNNTVFEFDPSITGDGSKIVFTSSDDDGNSNIWIINSDGTGLTQLTDSGQDNNPSISADGTKIAFVSTRNDTSGVYIMNSDGTGEVLLKEFAADPAMNANGTKVAFMKSVVENVGEEDETSHLQIFVINANGTGETQVTHNSRENVWPSFSPDDAKIAFQSQIDVSEGLPHAEIYTINTDGTGETNVTNHASNSGEPSFGGCNQPPTADAGSDQTIECSGGSMLVQLDGSGSSDPDNDTLTYSWKEGATEIATGPIPFVNLSNGTHTITLTVTDLSNASDTDDVTITIQDTTAPVITLNGDNPMTVECNTSFSDPGASANDGCAGPVGWSATGSVDPTVPGSYTITYLATDGTNQATATRTVNVVDTIPPVITLNGNNPMTVECHTSFTDPGASANDGCAGPVSWGATGSVDLNVPGSYTITYSATDGTNQASATRTVNVVDTTAPTITMTTNVIRLNTANHKYVTFNVSDFVSAVSDGCDSLLGINNVVIVSVSSDEPENSNLDGNTTNDIVIAPNCKSLQLRAERADRGNGRVYTITLKVKDPSGNIGTAVRKVFVPMTAGGNAIEGPGPGYTVNGCNP